MYPADPQPHRTVRAPSRAPSVVTGVLAVLLLLVASALLYTVVSERREPAPPARITTPEEVARAITPRGDLASDEQSTIELFQRTSPSVVHVTNLVLRRSGRRGPNMNVLEIPQGTGSGFLWDSSGHVVTNFHVVKGSDIAEVTLSDGSRWKADIVGVEPDKDIAVLKLEEAPTDRLRGLALGTSKDLQVGQKVFAIGNPFGLDQTLTTGIISGLDREIKSISGRPIEGVIQTDAAINQGNSGGPLLDSAGRLIGVNTAILSPSGTSAGVGFAVPVDTVSRVVPQLIAHGHVERPGLGIQIVPDKFAKSQGIEGVVVGDVVEGGAAARAGMLGVTPGPNGGWIVGDIITAMGDKKIRDNDDLYRALDTHKVGDKVKLEVVNQRQKRTLEVTLQALPAER